MGFLRNNIELKNISKTQFRETYFIKNVIENLFNRMLQESKKYNETNVYISKSRHEDDEKMHNIFLKIYFKGESSICLRW